MRIIARKKLRDYWDRHPESEQPLAAWYREVEQSDWSSPADVMERFPNASIISDNRVVFRIRGNNYRIVVRIFYPAKVVYLRFVGTHHEYDRINAEEV